MIFLLISQLFFIDIFSSEQVTRTLDLSFFIQKKAIDGRQNLVNIKNIPVVHQGHFAWTHSGMIDSSQLSWDDIKKVEGGNCGYHALRNVLTLLQDQEIIDGDASDKTKEFLKKAQDYENIMSIWGPIIAKDRSSKDISWLGGQELDLLIQKFANNLPIIVIEYLPGQEVEIDEQRLRVIQKFVGSNRAKLGFIWNSGVQSRADKISGTHWVGFVAVKNGKNIVLYNLNSAPGTNPDFKAIINLFASTPEEIETIIDERLIHTMRADINVLERNFLIFKMKEKDSRIYDKYEGCENNEGIWSNSKTKNKIRYKSGLNCSQMQQRYPGTWLIETNNKEQFIFRADEMLHDIFRVCLINWKDYQSWPMQVQIKMAELLLQYIEIAKNNPTQIEELLKDFNVDQLNFILKKLPLVEIKSREIKDRWQELKSLFGI